VSPVETLPLLAHFPLDIRAGCRLGLLQSGASSLRCFWSGDTFSRWARQQWLLQALKAILDRRMCRGQYVVPSGGSRGAPQGVSNLALGWLARAPLCDQHGVAATNHRSEVSCVSSPRSNLMKIKLITALTTVALFALPVAEAFANRGY
jgi:hypothetical protein